MSAKISTILDCIDEALAAVEANKNQPPDPENGPGRPARCGDVQAVVALVAHPSWFTVERICAETVVRCADRLPAVPVDAFEAELYVLWEDLEELGFGVVAAGDQRGAGDRTCLKVHR